MNILLDHLHAVQEKIQQRQTRKLELERIILNMSKSHFEGECEFNWEAFDKLTAERLGEIRFVGGLQEILDGYHLPLLEKVGEAMYCELKRCHPIDSKAKIEYVTRDRIRSGLDYMVVSQMNIDLSADNDLPRAVFADHARKHAQAWEHVVTTHGHFALSRLVAYAPELHTLYVSDARDFKIIT